MIIDKEKSTNFYIKIREIFLKKVIRLLIPCFLVIFITGCGTEDETSSDRAEGNEKEETMEQDSEDAEEEVDITFGEKMDVGEEETIEEIFEFLGSIKLPSFSLDNPEELHYMFDKKFTFSDDDPTFFAHLTYDDGASGDLLAETHLYISNHEDKLDYGEMLDTEEETLSNGVEVTIGKYDTEFITTIFEEDGIYYRF